MAVVIAIAVTMTKVTRRLFQLEIY